jgi:hypothetical protein
VTKQQNDTKIDETLFSPKEAVSYRKVAGNLRYSYLNQSRKLFITGLLQSLRHDAKETETNSSSFISSKAMNFSQFIFSFKFMLETLEKANR